MKNHIKLKYIFMIVMIIIFSFFIKLLCSSSNFFNLSSKKSDNKVYTNHKSENNVSQKSIEKVVKKTSIEDKTDFTINKVNYTEKSSGGKDIKIHMWGKDNAKNKIAILGSMHGDEPQGKYIIEKLMKYINDNPKTIENLQIMFIPLVNPDGLEKCTRVNLNKIDLNRNFPTKNWKESKKNSRYYSGSKKASESEVNMLINYIGKFNPQYIINIHSPLKVVNYDGQDGEKIAKIIAKHNNYKVVGDIGYPTPGSLGTYFGKERNIPVITLETSEEDGEVTWSENKDGILEVLNYMNNKS
ncbi:DUF2817 domain-containing protein [Clostridium novyi]